MEFNEEVNIAALANKRDLAWLLLKPRPFFLGCTADLIGQEGSSC